MSTIENEHWYTTPRSKAPEKTYIAITVNGFDTIVLKTEVDAYLKHKSILKDNINKEYYIVLGQCTELQKNAQEEQRVDQKIYQTWCPKADQDHQLYTI